MKKRTRLLWLPVALAAALCFCLLAGCVDDGPAAGEKTVVIVVGDRTVEETTDQEYVGQLLRRLKEEGKLTMTASESEYGLFITAIGSIEVEESNEFIAFYSSSTDVAHAGSLTPIEVGGVKYYSANKGVDTMPLIDGVTYLFRLETFSL